MTLSKPIKIMLVVLVLVLVAGVWTFKQMTSMPSVGGAAQAGAAASDALDATTLDLAGLQRHGLPILLNFGGDG
jgi:hypothetical protein